jgi:hypothetical protein
MRADRVLTGSFGRELEGSYVMVPFDVPAGTTAVRVKYCFDQPESPLAGTPTFSVRHTLDLGLYEPRRAGSRVWGPAEFRGWGGSSHPDITVSAEGFSGESDYAASPRVETPGKTTRAFLPGPIRPGQWAAELGVAAVVPREQGDFDGAVEWRVEVELARDAAFADEPYRPATYDTTPARRGAGWYAGDLHVHAEHSAYGDAPMREALDFAFRPLSAGGAGLDFVTLSDYVSGSSWGEVGRHQSRYPGKLIGRSAEVITYRGHVNNHNTARAVDYRTGPVLERRGDGSLAQIRGARPAREILQDIRSAGGYTQINHPTIFPSSVPAFGNFCRGCSWEYDAGETDYSQVDGIEVATGPSGAKTEPRTGPNPFTLTAIDFYERALATGRKIAAVGVSDSHNAGRSPNPVTQSPIGEATTVVYAQELSEQGVECAVEAGHTYAKITGNGGPDLRFEASTPGATNEMAMMGDTVRGSRADFSARVTGGAGRELLVVRNGSAVATVPVQGGDFTYRFGDATPGRYRLQLQSGQTVETVSSPIYLEGGGPAIVRRDCTPLRVNGSARGRVPRRRWSFPARCSAEGARLERCTVLAQVRTRPRRRKGARRRPPARLRTVGRRVIRMTGGSRRVRVKLNKLGRRLLRRHRRGRAIKVTFTASDDEGGEAQASRRTRLVRRRATKRLAAGGRPATP